LHYFGERGHGADLDAIAGCELPQFLDSAQIDHNLGLLDAILEPVEAVEPSGQHPGIVPCCSRSFCASATELG
jgi:hypothetical protein